jgi:hypothetical protein
MGDRQTPFAIAHNQSLITFYKENTMQSTGLENAKKVAYFEYDFAKHGGAVGEITVKGNPIPAGAIIKEGLIHVKTAVTSSLAATVQIKALSADDILASTAKATLALNALVATVPVGTAASAIRVTSAITGLVFTVGTGDLTAGKIVVALEYIVTA